MAEARAPDRTARPTIDVESGRTGLAAASTLTLANDPLRRLTSYTLSAPGSSPSTVAYGYDAYRCDAYRYDAHSNRYSRSYRTRQNTWRSTR